MITKSRMWTWSWKENVTSGEKGKGDQCQGGVGEERHADRCAEVFDKVRE